MAPPEMERASTTGAAAKGRTPQVPDVLAALAEAEARAARLRLAVEGGVTVREAFFIFL